MQSVWLGFNASISFSQFRHYAKLCTTEINYYFIPVSPGIPGSPFGPLPGKPLSPLSPESPTCKNNVLHGYGTVQCPLYISHIAGRNATAYISYY